MPYAGDAVAKMSSVKTYDSLRGVQGKLNIDQEMIVDVFGCRATLWSYRKMPLILEGRLKYLLAFLSIFVFISTCL